MTDIIIHGGSVITMERDDGTGIINNGAVAIKGDKIVAVGETADIMRDYKAERYIDATGKVVMPGFIDAHMHSDMALMKGLAQDSNNWMQSCVWPYTEVITTDEVKNGSMVFLMEALRAGTTTFCDYHEYVYDIVENYKALGVRACLAQAIQALAPNASDIPIGELYPLENKYEDVGYQKNLKLINEYHMYKDGLITGMLGPMAPDRVTKEMMLEVNETSKKYNIGMHMHLSCGTREINQMEKRYGRRSIPLLDDMGLINERMIGVHLSVATDEELEHFAKKGGAMVLCSGSEAIIDGNVPPAFEFSKSSSRLALGSDQTAGGNTSNMFNEMKFTAILNKCKFGDPTVFPAWKVLRMATIDGARAMGLGDMVGSLKPGKKADMIIVDFQKPTLTPLLFDPIRNIVPNLVYAANGSEVETSIINGEIVMENREFTRVNEKELIDAANASARALAARTKDKMVKIKNDLYMMMQADRI
ncbi:MAG: amidohydrolase [Bacillota bacterium]|nr:amidohydrolase [Bacillota bacterium]